MATESFRVRVKVRGYEVDVNGHVNQAVYLQYAEHARWECLAAAGFTQEKLAARAIGPVALEATIRYLRELRAGDEVDVTCGFDWSGGGKTFRLEQEIIRTDGTLVAQLSGKSGVLDLSTRRLVDPVEALRSLASDPSVLGL